VKFLTTLSRLLVAGSAVSFFIGFVGSLFLDLSLTRTFFASAWAAAVVVAAAAVGLYPRRRR